ncbi:MAG: hypothetical protein ACTSRU_04440 [Candidatus Hodarchaeales archaeon]
MLELTGKRMIIIAIAMITTLVVSMIGGIFLIQYMVDREVQAGIDATDVDIQSIKVTGMEGYMVNLTINITMDNPYSVSAIIEAFSIEIFYGPSLLSIIYVPELHLEEKQESIIFNTTLELVETDYTVYVAFSIDFLADGEVSINAISKITISARAFLMTVKSTADLNKTIIITWEGVNVTTCLT